MARKKDIVTSIIDYRNRAINHPPQRPNSYHYSFLNDDLSEDRLESMTLAELQPLLGDIRFEYEHGGSRREINQFHRRVDRGPYNLGGRVFKRKSDIRQYISDQLNQHLNMCFMDDVMYDVLNHWDNVFTRHGYRLSPYFCFVDDLDVVDIDINAHDFNMKMYESRQHPILLVYCPDMDAYVSLSIYQFDKDNQYGLYDHDFKAVAGVYRDILFKSNRLRHLKGRCCDFKGCNETEGLAYHHHCPTMYEILTRDVLPYVSDDDFKTCFDYCKFDRAINSRMYYVPETHPSIAQLFAAHESNEYYTLCSKHHFQVDRALRKGHDLMK